MSHINRRTIVAGIAGAVPAAAVASVPAFAAEPDPALAAVARARAAYDAMMVTYRTAEDDDTCYAAAAVHDEAYYDLIDTVPTTVNGLAAVIAFMAHVRDGSRDGFPYLRGKEDTVVFFKTLDEALRRMTGAAA